MPKTAPNPARRVKIFFDGGCRPNPGRIEAAVVVRGQTYLFDDLGEGTNSDAEWRALICAVEVAQSLALTDVELIGDAVEVIIQKVDVLRHQIDLAVVLPEGYEEYDKGGHGDHEPGTRSTFSISRHSDACVKRRRARRSARWRDVAAQGSIRAEMLWTMARVAALWSLSPCKAVFKR